MTETKQPTCRCGTCPGAACNCGCQRPADPQTCDCGTDCRCGPRSACACAGPKA